MRFFVFFLLFLNLFACAKKDTCLNPAVKQNQSGFTLATSITYSMPGGWLKALDKGQMSFEERIIDPISQARIKVFYFEGMRDMVSENIQRWKKQFQSDSMNILSEKLIEKNGLQINELIISGTFIDKLEPMNPNSDAILRPNHMLRAYIVETQTGTWFFKALASENVMQLQENNFKNFVNGLKAN